MQEDLKTDSNGEHNKIRVCRVIITLSILGGAIGVFTYGDILMFQAWLAEQ